MIENEYSNTYTRCVKRKKNKLPTSIKNQVKDMYNRVFTYEFEKKQNFDISSMFKSEKWEYEKLINMKCDLNELKSQLNDKEISKWHEHTNFVNPARDIKTIIKFNYKLEMCTQAWCKFYEILNRFPIAPSDFNSYDKSEKFSSVHLCEAPGAFITALNHYVKSNNEENSVSWQWLANTLNPYYEGNSLSSMINDDRLILPTIDRWMFGVDDTGDILNIKNIESIRDEVLSKFKRVDLVTADGSIDCSLNPACQETDLLTLHLCELSLALMILSPGGALVFKVFTLYESSSICIMYLLNRIFSKVHVFKPMTSKGGNSEVYLICENYLGSNVGETLLKHLDAKDDGILHKAMFPFDDIEVTFLDAHRECVAYFADIQRRCIRRNISLYEIDLTPEDVARIERTCLHCKDMYIVKNHLRKISISDKVVADKTNFHGNYRRDYGVYLERSNTRSWSERFHRIKPHIVTPCHLIEYYGTIDIDDCSVHYGPLVAEVRTSVFCDNKYMCEYNDLIANCDWSRGKTNIDDIMKKDALEVMEAACDQSKLEYSKEDNKIHFIKISDFVKTLKEVERGDDIIVTIPLCVRRYHVSFVYLMCCLFHKIMVVPMDISFEYCYLIGRNYKMDTKCDDLIDHLDKAVSDNVLQWLPISYILDENFFLQIYKCNNEILKTWINELIKKEKIFLNLKAEQNHI